MVLSTYELSKIKFAYIGTVITSFVYVYFIWSIQVVYICTVKPGFVYTCPVDNRVYTVKTGFVLLKLVWHHPKGVILYWKNIMN